MTLNGQNFNFHILDICAPVHSPMCVNMAMSQKQRNLSIRLPALAPAYRGHHVKLGLCVVRLFSSNSAILCFCLTVKSSSCRSDAEAIK